jgi:hypothetical protein
VAHLKDAGVELLEAQECPAVGAAFFHNVGMALCLVELFFVVLPAFFEVVVGIGSRDSKTLPISLI